MPQFEMTELRCTNCQKFATVPIADESDSFICSCGGQMIVPGSDGNNPDDKMPDDLYDFGDDIADVFTALDCGGPRNGRDAIKRAMDRGNAYNAIDVFAALHYFNNRDGHKAIKRHTQTIMTVAAMLAESEQSKQPIDDNIDLAKDSDLKNLEIEMSNSSIPSHIRDAFESLDNLIFYSMCVGGKGGNTGNELHYKAIALEMGRLLLKAYRDCPNP